MRKTVLIIIAVLVGSAFDGFAQSGFSIKAGANYSSLRAPTYGKEWDLDMGFTVGVSKHWQLSKRLGLTTEVLYTSKQGVLKDVTVGPFLEWTSGNGYDLYADLRFIELPVLLRVGWPTSRLSRLEVHAGPCMNVAIADNSHQRGWYVINGIKTIKFDYVFPLDPGSYTGTNSGLDLDVGLALHFSFLSVDFRYSRGLHQVERFGGLIVLTKLDAVHMLVGLDLEEFVHAVK